MDKLVNSKSLKYFAKLFKANIKEYVDDKITESVPIKTSQLENDSNFANIYVGTLAEYEAANNEGLIPEGAIVIITDDNEGVGEIAGDIAKLGYAKLGELILGKEV